MKLKVANHSHNKVPLKMFVSVKSSNSHNIVILEAKFGDDSLSWHILKLQSKNYIQINSLALI